MATSRLNLTRDQLATFLKDHELIKQFERLFATVDVIAPDLVNEIAISAGSAQATANDALALIESLENSLTADGSVIDAKATLALQELQALKSELQLKSLEPAEQNNNAIITDYLTINEHGHGENAVGRMIWDEGEGTIDFGLKGGNVVCKIGVQEYVRAYNDTLLTMTKGQIVYISGAQGNRVAVKLARADSEANSAHTIGIVAETISNGGEGFVQVSGPIYKLNTLGTIAGDIVYLSPTIAGAFTTTKPVAPDQLVILGFIERVHATVGSIFIKVDNGYELDELHNVKITSIQPDDLLQYYSAGPYWKNVAPSAISIGTATNLAGGAAGSLPYQTAASTTTFLGIGAANYVLTSTGTAPTWTANTGTGSVVRATSPTLVTPLLGTPTSGNFSTGTFTWPTFNQNTTGTAAGLSATLVATSGGTGQSSYAVGDLLYASTTTALSKLADVATGNALISGGVGVAPAWGKIGLTTHVSGTLPVANGGTGITSLGAGVATWLGTPSSANLAAAVTDETGTGLLVFGTSPTIATPTITTSATVPLVIGGTGTTDTLTLRATSGVGTTGSNIVFQVGNNGANEAMRVLDSGYVGIGSASPAYKLDVAGTVRSTGQFISTQANSATTGGGQIYLSGTGGNRIDFINQGFAAPAFTTRSAGTKIVLFPELDAVNTDYALGIASSVFWSSIPGSTRSFVWYAGTTEVFRVKGDGEVISGNGDTSAAPVSAVYRATDGVGTNIAGANLSIQGGRGTGTGAGGYVRFLTAPAGTTGTTLGTATERMRIDSTGKVGIGTAAPASKLQVFGGTDTTFSPNVFNTRLTGDSSATSGNSGAGISFQGYTTGTTTISDLAFISGIKENTTDGNYAGALVFGTRTNGSGGGNFEQMRILSSGNVGIGTATNLSTLTVNGSFASKSPSTVNAATYTVAATDGSLRFTTTNCTVTLPAPASFPGRILYLNTITANSVTSASANVIPLGSNTAGTAILAATAAKFAMLQSDGTNWITMMAN